MMMIANNHPFSSWGSTFRRVVPCRLSKSTQADFRQRCCLLSWGKKSTGRESRYLSAQLHYHWKCFQWWLTWTSTLDRFSHRLALWRSLLSRCQCQRVMMPLPSGQVWQTHTRETELLHLTSGLRPSCYRIDFRGHRSHLRRLAISPLECLFDFSHCAHRRHCQTGKLDCS